MASFEILVIIASLGTLFLLQNKDKNSWKKYIITAFGVLLFEYFTQALWLNNGLAAWSYLYLDVNWVLTLGWTAIILVSASFVDYTLSNISEKKKYILYIITSSIIAFFAESLVNALGIREYSSASQTLLSGIQIFGSVPIEALYYIPVFLALVISFKRYWEISLETPNIKKFRRNK